MNHRSYKFILVSFLVTLILSCRQGEVNSQNLAEPNKTTDNLDIINGDYDYDNPEVWILDKALIEISGLAYRPSSHTLLSHNDELGTFYELNMEDGSVINEFSLEKNGDYEGIAELNGKVLVTENNGKLFIYDPISQKITTQKTDLKRKNDVEGLCEIPQENALLFACKGQTLNEEKTKSSKAIYRYDFENKWLDEKPYLLIKDKDLLKHLESQNLNESKFKLKNLQNRLKSFAPSGISFHPQTGELYIISARGSILTIFKNKEIADIIFLNENTNPQPEGICFDKEGNLYISSEGKGFSGKIFKYKKS